MFSTGFFWLFSGGGLEFLGRRGDEVGLVGKGGFFRTGRLGDIVVVVGMRSGFFC